MKNIYRLFAVVLSVSFCLGFASCALFVQPQNQEENTSPFSTEPETTPEETTPAVTEPDFSNTPDPDGTKRY